ncbi:MAG: sensor domain-containing diguanylate cyclase [Spirochaetota bacterium]
MRSLGSEVSLINLVFSTLLVAALATVLGLQLYDAGVSNAEATLRSRNEAVRYFIQGAFSEIQAAVEVLADNEDVRRAADDPRSRREARALFRSFARSNEHISYVYAGHENGSLLINDYTPPTEYDVVDRPWYQAAMEAAPRVSTGTPYQDVIDEEWLVSVGKALPGLNGVVAIDSSIDQIAALLEEQGEGYASSYSFVTDETGTILIHHDERYVNRPIRELVEGEVTLEGARGRFEYALAGVPKTAIFSRIDHVGWLVITVVEQAEILRPVRRSIVVILIVVALATAAVTTAQIAILRKRFVRPTLELHRRVRSIVRGDEVAESGYVFPNNEIGMTAREVAQLAEHELLERSRRLQETNDQISAANSVLRRKNVDLFRMSMIDEMTGLYNRRMLEWELEREHRLAARSKRCFSVLLVDVDHFKSINDRFGHQTGDEVLARIGELIRNSIRSTDIPGRWGGEEFLILCPETDRSGAAAAADSVRAGIESAAFAIPGRVTVSVGAAELRTGESVSSLVTRADENLYAAKAGGRNRVVT